MNRVDESNYLFLNINGEPTDEYYCRKHNNWDWAGNECNCCIMADEEVEEASD